jgi:hypothetical protein
VLEGIARVHGSAPNKKTALLRDPLLELIDRIDTSTPAGLRDRALLLLGFAVGLRRSELVALTVEDLSPSPDGLRIRIARSKTDQHGRGQELLVVYAEAPRPCPVRALRAWIDTAAMTTGPIFRRVTRTGAISSPLSAQTVALIIKKRASAAGLAPTSSPATRCAQATPPRPPATATTPPRSLPPPATKTNASSPATSAPAEAKTTSRTSCDAADALTRLKPVGTATSAFNPGAAVSSSRSTSAGAPQVREYGTLRLARGDAA